MVSLSSSLSFLPPQKLDLKKRPGDLVSISSASLPKGTFVKLRPHTSDFLDISNPRAVLETTLRGYSCLTVGDAICLHYNAKRYYIDVIEARPANAVSVIETDCEVDFAPPLDYVEPVYAPRGEGAGGAVGAGSGGAGGEAVGPMADASAAAAAAGAPSTSGAGAAAAGEAPAAAASGAEEKQEPAFVPFVGPGRRLDGKPAAATAAPPPSSSSAPPPSSAPVAVPAHPSAAGGAGASGSVGGGGSSASGSARAQGTVVFGGGNRLLAKQQQEKKPGGAAAANAAAPPAEEKKDSAPSFEAFKGKGRSLRD